MVDNSSQKHSNWYSIDSDKVIDYFNSSKDKGLSGEQVEKQENKYGKNSFVKIDKFRLVKIFFSNFNNILIYVLFGAALISFFAKEKIEFYVIIVIILLTVFLSFFQQFSADRTVKALNNLRPKSVIVIRDSKKVNVAPEDLVPGDIVELNRGDMIPADMRVIQSVGLAVDESTLTGESVSKSKSTKSTPSVETPISERTNILFASTSVTSGSGLGIVYSTGFDTEIGKLSKDIQEAKNAKSPLQKKVDNMSKQISLIILGVCILLFILLLLNNMPLLTALLIVGAVAVAGIPESFPLALTLALSKGVRDMSKKNALLKNLNAVETLGNTTVICTDKTGTLTENKMKVSMLHFSLNDVIDIEGEAYVPHYTFSKDNKEIKPNFNQNKEFFLSSVLCNNSSIYKEGTDWKLDGEPTEGAFVALAQSIGYDEIDIRKSYEKLYEVPFTPEKKYMITLHKQNNSKKHVLSMKGAAERVLNKCTHYRNSKGKISKLDDKIKNHFLGSVENYTSKGNRVLAVASKHMSNEAESKIKKNIERGYTLEGFVGIEDPIRKEVFQAVETCKNAGIKITMITGDHKLTAKSIAEKLKIIESDKDIILTGEELNDLSDQKLDDIIGRVRVFSRVTPEDKFRIITSLQKRGEVVAMTGDGVNDAPALKKADIGVSMGKNGTEVAREASDMILLDDNFSTIVSAVREGRTIYSNIRRFIYYLLTTNFAQVGIMLMAVLIGLAYSLPLSALMILFVNMVTSTFPALALSIEPTHKGVMQQRPRHPKENILSSYILSKIVIIFPIMLFGALTLYLWELLVAGSSLEKAMTVAFLVMIFGGLFHTFNARKLHTTVFDKSFFDNIYVFISVGFSAFLTFLLMFTEYGRVLFGLEAIGLLDWVLVLVFSVAMILFSEIIKLSIRVEMKEQSSIRGLKNYFE